MTLWSMKAAIDTAAEWVGAIDPSAVVLPEAPFPDAPDLRPGPASAIRTRASSLVKPSACLGAKYNGRFGAWMRARRARGRSRWRIRA